MSLEVFKDGVRCRIRKGWVGEGLEGDAICIFNHARLGQLWVLVIWDYDEDPETHKAAGLMLKSPGSEVWEGPIEKPEE